jgi:hypothetical protein
MINNEDYFNENLPAGFDGQFDWDFLKEAFNPTNINFMDLDGIVERNNRFLIIETKSTGSSIPFGQNMTLNALHNLGCFTILYIKGKAGERITDFSFMFPNDDKMRKINILEENPYKAIFKIVQCWFRDADNYGNKTIKFNNDGNK